MAVGERGPTCVPSRMTVLQRNRMAAKKRYRDDWRVHQTLSGDTNRRTAWGLWVTAPHVGLHLADLYPSKSEAMSAAREAIGKGWADSTVVRKITLGPCTTMSA